MEFAIWDQPKAAPTRRHCHQQGFGVALYAASWTLQHCPVTIAAVYLVPDGLPPLCLLPTPQARGVSTAAPAPAQTAPWLLQQWLSGSVGVVSTGVSRWLSWRQHWAPHSATQTSCR
jgi:hypothetical protein